jgi:type IV pilus assembly protein PilB
MQDRDIAEKLVRMGLLSQACLDSALRERDSRECSLEEVLVERGYVDEKELARAIASRYGMHFVDLAEQDIPEEVASLLDDGFVQRHLVYPLSLVGRELTLGMVDPVDVVAEDHVRQKTGLDIKRVKITRSALKARFERRPDEKKALADLVSRLPAEMPMEFEDVTEAPPEEEEAEENSAPVIKMVNTIISEAIRMGASDIHIEPRAGELAVRYRIDGRLTVILRIPRYLQSSILSRFKLIAGMDIGEKRKPQDGRTLLKVSDRTVDLRVATLPTFHGEEIVLRILDRSKLILDPALLGLSSADEARFNDFLSHSQGMILITGPTGSGKTSTLYTALSVLNRETLKILTVEDPVEFQLPGINQVQINERAGVTFASTLRSMLRHDPNIIMVGEIRDSETGEIAFQAAQTGHLVLSTLHTLDAASAVMRLVDLGLPPFLISSSLVGVVAQRLVRRLCPRCREQYEPDEVEAAFFRSLPPEAPRSFHRPRGCAECSYQGYRGRIGIYEFLQVTSRMRELIAGKASTEALQKCAEEEGMTTMAVDGLLKIASGITTLDEVREAVYLPDPGAAAEKARTQKTGAAQEASPLSPETERACPQSAEDQRRTMRILIIDDDREILNAVTGALIKEGHRVISASDGVEGLRAAFQENPDLIISDVMMPDLDGFEIVRILRQNLPTALTPIILITGREGEEHELDGLDLGADDYIRKPFSLERLRARVRAQLRRSTT